MLNMSVDTFSAMWQPTHRLNFYCPAVADVFLFFCACVCVCMIAHTNCIYRSKKKKKGTGRSRRKNWALAILFTARDFDICCLVRRRLNKFKVKQTARILTHCSSREKHCWETVLVLFRIQMNVEGTLLYEWRKTVDPDRQSTQARYKYHASWMWIIF